MLDHLLKRPHRILNLGVLHIRDGVGDGVPNLGWVAGIQLRAHKLRILYVQGIALCDETVKLCTHPMKLNTGLLALYGCGCLNVQRT